MQSNLIKPAVTRIFISFFHCNSDGNTQALIPMQSKKNPNSWLRCMLTWKAEQLEEVLGKKQFMIPPHDCHRKKLQKNK